MVDPSAVLCGTSRAIEAVRQSIERAAASEEPVLLLGEAGSEHEVVAHAIHSLGARGRGPFVRVRCAALPPDLLVSELFGMVGGSMKGGRFYGMLSKAEGGTLFLDEVAELSNEGQVRLLTVLDRGEFTLVGDRHVHSVTVRVIAADVGPIGSATSNSPLRPELLDRLRAIVISLPPLRERQADIPGIVAQLIKMFAEHHRLPIPACSPATMDCFARHRWPGDLRQLLDAVEHAVLVASSESRAIQEGDLPPDLPQVDLHA